MYKKRYLALGLLTGALCTPSVFGNPASTAYVDAAVTSAIANLRNELTNQFNIRFNELTNTINQLPLITHQIGEIFQGGLVFYVDPSKQHGLMVLSLMMWNWALNGVMVKVGIERPMLNHKVLALEKAILALSLPRKRPMIKRENLRPLQLSTIKFQPMAGRLARRLLPHPLVTAVGIYPPSMSLSCSTPILAMLCLTQFTGVPQKPP